MWPHGLSGSREATLVAWGSTKLTKKSLRNKIFSVNKKGKRAEELREKEERNKSEPSDKHCVDQIVILMLDLR